MKYNIYFELAALAFLTVLNIYIRLQYNSDSENNRRFKALGLVLLTAVAMDVITAVTISYYAYVPAWINTALNFAYLCSDIALEYYFVMYCMLCAFERKLPAIVYTTRAVCAASFAVLLVNFFTGWVYSFDETGYVKGPIYMLIYAIPIIAVLASIVLLFIGFAKFSKSQRWCVSIYAIIVIVGAVVQLVRPDILFVLFTIALGFVTLTFSMETPDFQELNKTMEELRGTRDAAESAMAAAQTANEVKSQFMSTMSHELRTPINAIMGYSETIQRETENAEILQYSSNILTASRRLISMVNDILSFTEMESEDFALETGDYSTASFLMDAISAGEYYTEKKNLEFRTNISENIPVLLRGDCPRLTQVMDNLLSNAAKYTEEGHVELNIGWELQENGCGTLSVSVKDTGIGMRDEDAALVSSAFVRFDREHTHNVQGLGLGLTIVTRLLSLMGSRLEVWTEYGKGTEMSFKLTQKVSDYTPVGEMSSSSAETDAKGAGFTASGASVLAVDDNEINRELIVRCLAETRAAVDTAENGAKALELIKERHYDMIFLDHMMPVMDGMKTLSIIKSDNLCPGVPIVVVTANALSGDREMYLDAGFDDYVSKPFTSKKLCEVMKKFLPSELVTENDPDESAARGEGSVNEGKSPLLRRLSFLNTEMGMAYCCDDEDFYLQIITTYIEENKSDGIRWSLASGDIDGYRIRVHALKGTSRTIGADDMSEEARKLEMAARENDRGYIDANTERVLAVYNALIDRIRSAIDG